MIHITGDFYLDSDGISLDEYFKKQDAFFNSLNARTDDLFRTLEDGRVSAENAPTA